MRAFRLAYDGTGYRGFQRQPHGDTVENALLEALTALGVSRAGTPPGYAAAGRTDAGVSARAQTVAFEAPEWLRPRALNAELPADVGAWAWADVPDAFHATHDAIERAYRYYLYAPDADDGLAALACRRLSGRHDFRDLTPDDSGTVRELSASVRRDGPFLVVTARAGGFPRQFVRRFVSVLEAVARKRRPSEFLDRILDDEPLEGPEGIPAAAPEPLVLLDVEYPAVSFSPDERAVERVRGVFDARRRHRLAGARVAGVLSGAGSDV